VIFNFLNFYFLSIRWLLSGHEVSKIWIRMIHLINWTRIILNNNFFNLNNILPFNNIYMFVLEDKQMDWIYQKEKKIYQKDKQMDWLKLLVCIFLYQFSNCNITYFNQILLYKHTFSLNLWKRRRKKTSEINSQQLIKSKNKFFKHF
jgi:hypothetical protein